LNAGLLLARAKKLDQMIYFGIKSDEGRHRSGKQEAIGT